MLLLRIDLGAGSVRAAALDREGSPVAEAERAYAQQGPEQPPEDWWSATVVAIQQVVKTLGPARIREIKTLGLTGHTQATVFMDPATHIICPARLGGSQRDQILWMRENEPERYARIRNILLPKDYIRFKITGICAADIAVAPATGLFDETGRTWSAELCQQLGIPLQWLPPLYEPGQETGKVIPGIGALTGLPFWIPVLAGGG